MVMTASKGYALPCNFFVHEKIIHDILQLKVVFEQAFTNHLHRAVPVNATSLLLTHATIHNCMTWWSQVRLNPRVFAVVAGQWKTAKKYRILDVYL